MVGDVHKKIETCRKAIQRQHKLIDYHKRKAACYEANARYESERLQDLLRLEQSRH